MNCSERCAHANLAAVTRDLSDLRLLLELMREERGIPVLLQAQTLQLLGCCGNVLIHVDTILAQCSDTDKWISTGRAEMASCRDSLETFREALGLALEVATLYEPYCTSPTSGILMLTQIQTQFAKQSRRIQCRRRQHHERGSATPNRDQISAPLPPRSWLDSVPLPECRVNMCPTVFERYSERRRC